MKILEAMKQYDYEQLVFCQDESSGLKAIIAIHDTTLGPALGGIRMWNYATEEEAIVDALRLARGMTYKAAVSGLNLGGGKTVIIGESRTDKSEAMFRALGRYVEGLNGRYITAEDVGTNEEDMNNIFLETSYVTGVSPAFGSSGNPSPVTAFGVYQGMKAAAKVAYGSDSLKGKKIAVQGVGNVAYHLCKYLHEEGAQLIVTDIYEPNVKRAVQDFGATSVHPDEIYDVDCDIFSPCALGAIVNDDTIDRLRCNVIAGSANNQLKEDRHGDLLEQKGIFYAPDYVINAGGLINVADELYGYNRERAMAKVEGIYHTIEKVFEIAKRDGIPTYQAADRLAEERIESLRKSRNMFVQKDRHALTPVHR
ncbi:Leu/Phe/Val dehydrogenase [Risungbinella massiliensis]|uniref:Leu/Phe/Val dehydrogenase n=1 Tax=Risungbinella massiliensis TaxID=1329796 RepID=UPI0005CBA400|nr:Glu/Leu/Phe/Val dehydrogenase [Risungbinella massiliensis]